MSKNYKPIALLFILLCVQYQVSSIPASPHPIKVQQPDGSSIEIMMRGDEFFHYEATIDGIPVVKTASGFYHYAQIDTDGKLIDMNIKAKSRWLRTDLEQKELELLQIDMQANISKLNQHFKAQRSFNQHQEIQKPMKFPVVGSPKSLVILVEYQDVSFTVQDPQEAFTNLLNEEAYSENGGTGSARDYFRDNSMGNFDPEFVVVGPYLLPQNMSYYGGNDNNGNDINPVQMVVDAVTAAYKDGVDLSEYDTDNDGYIDNVFVYYAGYNEAEWGGENTIWPHRWSVYRGYNYFGSEASITFNGKKLFDYACTSEFRGSSGANMAGIGTFVHEFGHVLGLPDFYATNGANHFTLNSWSVMDYGSYSNGGKTPPGYSSYERFLIGFHTPELLAESVNNIELEPLNASNVSYLVSNTNEHNLNVNSPQPDEFYLLENRQKTGWDTYLPGHGMLIYRVRHDNYKLYYNETNNDPNNMVLDIIEADNIANKNTMGGDPFPGTSGVVAYDFVLANGDDYYQSVNNIEEDEGLISFDFHKQLIIDATDSVRFNVEVGQSVSKTINITFKNKTTEELEYDIIGDDSEHFEVTNTLIDKYQAKIVVKFSPIIEGKLTAELSLQVGDNELGVQLVGNDVNEEIVEPTIPTTPEVPFDVSMLTVYNNGFDATWEGVDHADYYNIYVYTKEYNPNETTVLEENFDLVSNGAPNNSGVGSSDISASINSFTSTQGWSGNKIFEAGGALKIGSNSVGGFIETPTLDLSADDGDFYLYFDAMAWGGDNRDLYLVVNNVRYHIEEVLNNSSYNFDSFAYILRNGTNETKLKIESYTESKGRFFIDNIKITQKGITSETNLPGAPFLTSNNIYELRGLDNSKSYYYRVSAVNDLGESEKSVEVGPISLLSTSNQNVYDSDVFIKTVDKKIIVMMQTDAVPVYVYSLTGQLLYADVLQSGSNTIDIVGYSGVVLLKVGEETFKLILK